MIRLPRPHKEGLDYFPHDTDATSDEKLEAMRALHGNDGYAFYFILLERIYRTSNGELDISNISKKAAIVSKVGVSLEKFNAMLRDAFELELFDKAIYEQKCCITSNGIRKRVGEVKKLREKWRKKKEVFLGENKADNSMENGQKTPERKGNKEEEQEHVGKVFQFYQKNIGLITPFQAEVIGQYLDEGMEPDMIIAVMQDGIGMDVPWKWIEKVLANCDKSNIKTLVQYEAKKVEKQRKRDEKGNKSQGGKPTFNNFKNRSYDPEILKKWLLIKDRDDVPQEEKDKVYKEFSKSGKG